MIYNNGYETNSNLRFLSCPKCDNEKYSKDAKYCRICEFPTYYECEGSSEYDNLSMPLTLMYKNVGNAHYCAYCTKATIHTL